jgi:ferredoxin-NADP reductase
MTRKHTVTEELRTASRPSANTWVPATVVAVRSEGADTRTLTLDAPDLRPALAGQHVDIRVTAEDGYTAQRSYSLASPAGATPFEVTVDRLPDGEVSPYLVDGIEVDDRVEVRGPIGLWFVWRPEQAEPVNLIAGGSGLVPLMSIVRTRAATDSAAPFRLLIAARAPERDLYRDELDALERACDWLSVTRLYSRHAPVGDERGARRIDTADLGRFTWPASESPTTYICGPTAFVETIADGVAHLGHEGARIRAERFGASG